jgi:hypothetical protein
MSEIATMTMELSSILEPLEQLLGDGKRKSMQN